MSFFPPLGCRSLQITCSYAKFIAGKTCQFRGLASKVPDEPTWKQVDFSSLPQVPEVDLELVEQLERISLVQFNNEVGVKWLTESVKSATQLLQVDTSQVEPLDSVLEDQELWLRADHVTEGNCASDILSNATKVEEGYFVAPPGNVALKKRDKQNLKLSSKK